MKFNDKPGAHERHLRRRMGNPLFPESRREITEAEWTTAVRRDRQEQAAFMESFRDIVQRAIDLDAQAESEQILALKEDLDRCYEECAGLGGDQGKVKEGIRTLIGTIMRAVRVGAENDPLARQKLDEEDMARELHFRLLEQPLVADLLRPEPVIEENELVASLLSAGSEELGAVLELFSPEQLAVIHQEARQLITTLPAAHPLTAQARENLSSLETRSMQQAGAGTVN
ncbi:hypothetical protein QVG61_07565 [Thiohalobacter sp. IOR34]|uniref:hypothetical protein n=1 Tax=Thiohalobacter sp. IOR34 TaxID=3057176 RepID=UPI0025AFBC1B|nr:hypothetical protein [Thiohalobacter sp. IOR34]WJW74374.1 hypothetical protein QVG61_07565 [Thiohalobacter sp. IOR34]